MPITNKSIFISLNPIDNYMKKKLKDLFELSLNRYLIKYIE